MSAHNLLNMPYQPTTFVGREAEIDEIQALLTDPDCRLLTLVGPGGIGKTRLAVQAASTIADSYADGVCFVDLQPIQSLEFLVSTVADALGVTLNGQGDPARQLLHYLQEKRILFVLDNFEHLLNEEPNLLSTVLSQAAGVCVLVTSRAALNLQEEWVWTVPGLEYPEDKPDKSLEEYSAVQLFTERAWRVRKDFELAEEADSVIRICRLVEGFPLALELAASWTKTLPTAAIAEEIQNNLDFLTAQLRNVPERQRSMQVIFEQTWKMLTEAERNAFKQLAIFRGGFRYEAARAVAGASLPVLSMLVDKSLLRWEPDGRYRIHELLRQYAQEALEASSEETAANRARHSDYYADFLHQLTADMTGHRQYEAVQKISAELDNVRTAWKNAVASHNVTNIHKAAHPLSQFFDVQSRYQESVEAFAAAIRSVQQAEPGHQRDLTLARLHTMMGWQQIRLGDFDAAQTAFTAGQELYTRLNEQPFPEFASNPVSGMALLQTTLGNYKEAIRLAQEAVTQNNAQNNRHNLQIDYYVLASAHLSLGQVAAAAELAQQAYVTTQATGDRWMMAYVLTMMGNVARAGGDTDRARQHYQASYEIKQSFNDPEGTAVNINYLARIAWLEGKDEEAAELFQESYAIYQQINDRGGLATTLHGFGDVALAQGRLADACRYFQQALTISSGMEWTPLTLLILTSYAELLHRAQRAEASAELLDFIVQHPATEMATRDRAEKSRQKLNVKQKDCGNPANFGEQVTAIVAKALAELEVLATQFESMADEDEDDGRTTPHPQEQPLIDPLTPRELEVLHLIAEGLTNKQIADELFLSTGTVKWYTGQIYSKLQVSHRTQAVAHAREINLLEN